jgi:fatty-acyl-CoA synthase
MAATIDSALAWWARETPDSIALRIGDGALSFQELDRWAGSIGAWLQAQGVRPGARIGTLGGSSLRHCALLLGIIRAGAIASPLSVRLSAREIAEFYARVSPQLVFADSDQAERAQAARSTGAAIQDLALVDGLRTLAPGPAPLQADPDAPVGIIATSGSTASPKGAVLTHRSMLGYTAEFAMEEPWCGPGSRVLVLSPLATSAGFVQLVEFITLGATIRFEAAFDAERALALLAGERISVFMGVPLFFERIAACAGFASADLSALKLSLVGGARVPRALLETWMAKGCLLRQIYGQTEAGGSATMMSKRHAAQFPEKAGRGGMFTEVRTIDTEGRFCPPGVRGEIVVRGPALMQGYWNDAASTARTLVDGWLRTGDLGVLDEDGYLSFVDRIKDIIISGGLNISAAEVEQVVASYPGVLEVAVISAADDRFGETPMAIVHAAAGLDVAALVGHCNRHLADYKVPRYVVLEPASLPRLATGKIAKPALRERFGPLVPGLPRVR